MPYRTTEFRAGEYYHVYNRGHNFQPIFFELENYIFFLKQIRHYLIPAISDIVAYCLMPNHYHLLLHLKSDNFSQTMQMFGLSYVKAINKRYHRVGSLFQGPFQAIRIDNERYLIHLSRYIHLNPVLAGITPRAETWEFSSYTDYIGMRNGTLPQPEIVLSQFDLSETYRQFVESFMDRDSEIIKGVTLE